jgi:hypothetical protein
MAAYDIVPVDFQDATSKMRYGTLLAGEAFRPGELVFLTAIGDVEEFTDDGAQATIAQIDGTGNVCGIAASSGDIAGTAAGSGRFATTTYPSTAADGLPNTGDHVYFYPANVGIVFQTTWFHAAGGAGAAAIPDADDVGQQFQLSKPNAGANDNHWGVEETAGVTGTDVCALVVAVLDNLGRPLAADDATNGVTVHFTLHATNAAP